MGGGGGGGGWASLRRLALRAVGALALLGRQICGRGGGHQVMRRAGCCQAGAVPLNLSPKTVPFVNEPIYFRYYTRCFQNLPYENFTDNFRRTFSNVRRQIDYCP